MANHTLQAVLDDAVAAGAAPGLTAAVAWPDGRTESFAAGVRGLADPTPMTPDTLVWIASCTKAVTSAAALRLVEEGRLDLDAPVGALIPRLADLQVLDGFAGDGTPRLRLARTPVTLRHLLTHTSGLSYDFCNADLARYHAQTGGNLFTGLMTSPVLVFEPGESWQYGTGIDVAGWLVEAATGVGLDAYVTETITGPLGMTDSVFVTEGFEARLAGMHRRGEAGIEAGDRMVSPPMLYGGGGLHSTAPDYLKFLRAVMADDGAGVLGPQALKGLREPATTLGAPGALVTSAPALSGDFRPLPGTPMSWTLGFLRNETDAPGMRRAGSLAWGGLANCYYWADPASGVAGMMCAQLLPFADPALMRAFKAFERTVYAA